MTIDLNTATTEEILAEYKTGIAGVTEVLEIFVLGVERGVLDPFTEESAEATVAGFKESGALIHLLPEDVQSRIRSGVSGEILEVSRLVIDLHETAKAHGRKSTLSNIVKALGALGMEITRRDAQAGNEGAQRALLANDALIQELGL